MTDTELISSWINNPDKVKTLNPDLIDRLRKEFPYFTPLHYLKALNNYDYKDAPLADLEEIFPSNRVLLFHLFNPAVQPSILIEREEEEATTEQELKTVSPGHQDYFSSIGIDVGHELPEKEKINTDFAASSTSEEKNIKESEEKDLMVVMSFSEWLNYLKNRQLKMQEEEAGKSALKAMWQKQKLAAVIEEEEEEIPEDVFKMAVESVTEKEEIVNESMARVYILQGKKERALAVYEKLSLLNPEKSTYFAKKIEKLKKEIDI